MCRADKMSGHLACGPASQMPASKPQAVLGVEGGWGLGTALRPGTTLVLSWWVSSAQEYSLNEMKATEPEWKLQDFIDTPFRLQYSSTHLPV